MRLLLILVLALTFAAPARGQVATWRAGDDGQVTATCETRTLAVYQSTPNPFKPYVQRLMTPGGRQVLRDQVADHPHHHGLMFAVSVGGVSFWEERDDSGRQMVANTTTDAGSVFQQLNWRTAEGRTLLNERRRIAVRLTDGATLLTWRTTLTPETDHQQVTLDGHHYYGLGMRLVESMDHVATFTHPDDSPRGATVRGAEKLTRGRWVAVTGPVNGQPVTVAMFDHPANPRHPAWWFTMPEHFAYQSATLNLWKQPLTLKRGDSLRLVYGVCLLDGPADIEQINTLYQQWVSKTPHKERPDEH